MSSLTCHAACAYASPRLKRRLLCECDMYVPMTVLLMKKRKKKSSSSSPDSMLCSCGPKCQLLSTDAILPLCPSLLRPRPKAVHKPGLERDFIQLHPIPLGRGSNAETSCLKKEI